MGRDIWKAWHSHTHDLDTQETFINGVQAEMISHGFAKTTKESDTVHNDERLYAQRVLPITTEVDPRGKVFMESHLKFRAWALSYFFDDTKGKNSKSAHWRD